MNKPTMWRLALIATVLVVCVFSALPLDKKIHLGLDLQGGMHLVYEVDADKAVVSSIDNLTEELKRYMAEKKISVRSILRENENILVALGGSGSVNDATGLMDENYPILTLVNRDDEKALLTYTYTSDYRQRVYSNAISQALETLRNRVDQFGVAEPTIQKEGENRILIQLPGVKDRKRAIALIGKTARLEFQMLDESMSPTTALKKGVPPGSRVLYEKKLDPVTKRVIGKTPYLVKKKVELTGGMLSGAEVRISQMNMPYVSITFNKQGSRIFARLTTANVGKRMAIVLDDNVYSAPVIKDRITGGSAMIEGNFNHQEARDLAIVLRAGALPAPLIKLEERTVGPSMGRDSIKRGVNSILIGAACVVIFMLVYYAFGGVIADIALLLNLVILAGTLAYFGATLTLPGIAGVILTIGMAVDANVLVFERIREEIKNGKTPRAAVESGFSKAFLTIVDANVTTLIAALVLFQFGTGPVKGFAITLSIGILASMFTAVFVSRTIFTLYMGSRRLTKLKI